MFYNILRYRQLEHNQLAHRTPLPPKPTYDYIVVGSGSAGAIVSCRLSEWGSDVLLLEAGGGTDALYDDTPILGLYFLGQHYQSYRFFQVEPQPYTGQSYFGGEYQIHSNVLGGGSTVNGMVYNRGNRKFFDTLSTKYGAIGWDYASVLPVFKLMENNTDPRVSDEYHGRQGPVGVSTAIKQIPLYEKQAQAAREWGHQSNDFNGHNQTGFTVAQSTIARGLRSSTLNAYLKSGLCPRLTIVTGAQVSKILIDHDDDDGDNNNGIPRANGVTFIKYNHTYHVWAKREIIVSAGPILSPQLLMLSGIGPVDHLNDKGITRIYVDLPGVGSNYRDHVNVVLEFPVHNYQPGLINPSSLTLDTDNLGQSPYTLFYLSTRNNPDRDDYPDVYLFSEIALNGTQPPVSAYKPSDIQSPLYQQFVDYIGELESNEFFQVRTTLVRAMSSGTVRLNTSRIEDQPLIDPRFLTAEIDRLRLREAVVETFRFVETTSFGQYVRLPRVPMPPCQYCPDGRPVYQCLSYIDCLIREWAANQFHPMGTCRMGDPSHRDTVVDPRLRVKGIRGLRIVDSSVYPEIVNANPNAAAMLVGEMGARFIREDNAN
ncbi:L-sorbose 1-dehydrogenase-like [Oppia nitens]|uniref:L-sorbose 1-dehydrogenase-like n=1 Tax=Oppia nitens TaxID=1686743 RepID=UPI0023DC0469|nr:L-sorbose 1-dehydrogenase-like [Oppia nitens]